MATLSQQDKQEIAEELTRVATWVTGPRQAKVEAIRLRILGEDSDEETAETRTTPAGDKVVTGGQNQPVTQGPEKPAKG